MGHSPLGLGGIGFLLKFKSKTIEHLCAGVVKMV
jgi:hypothetical protein